MSARLLPFRRLVTQRASHLPTVQTVRPLSASSARFKRGSETNPDPQRAAQQDREKMDTQANEYSKSGTDSSSAAQESAAFDPNSSNDPDEARKEAGKGNEVNPLDASPANPSLSSGTSEVSGGAGRKKSEGGGER